MGPTLGDLAVLTPIVAGVLLVAYVAGQRLADEVPLGRLPTDGKFLQAVIYTGALVAIWLSCYYFYGVLAKAGAGAPAG
ncbi:MAG: hypothetical protein GC160_09220 [Acidobacteria bacterium]|nr:hypothetical protein [Acidobacteriota bacterium]